MTDKPTPLEMELRRFTSNAMAARIARAFIRRGWLVTTVEELREFHGIYKGNYPVREIGEQSTEIIRRLLDADTRSNEIELPAERIERLYD